MIVLFSIVFLGLLGFGLILPVLPFMVEETGAGPTLITITLSLYSLGQMVGAPLWGKISDHIGRRRALLITMIGAAGCYVALGLADTLAQIMVVRLVSGLLAGNISVAYAYIADSTHGSARTKAMGMMGAAFGLGFIFGPAIGGFLSGVGFEDKPFLMPSVVAAGLATFGAVGVLLFLKESVPSQAVGTNDAENEDDDDVAMPSGVPTLSIKRILYNLRSQPVIAALIATNLLVIMFWALMEAIFSIWANRVIGLSPREVAMSFTYIGIVLALIQGVAIGPLSHKFGEVYLIRVALVFMTAGFVAMAFTETVWMLFVSMTFLSVGSSLFTPSLSSQISHVTAPERQGMVMGLNQGASSLGRVIGPLFSGALFAEFGPAAPYLLAAAGMVAGFVLYNSVISGHGLNDRRPSTSASSTE